MKGELMDIKDLDNYITGHWGEDSVPSQDYEQEQEKMVALAKLILGGRRQYPSAALQLAELVLEYFGESE